MAHRYKKILPSAWFHGGQILGAALLHGDDEGARISLSNIRVTCAYFKDGIAKAYAFSSVAGGHWTSYDATERGSRVICGTDYWAATGLIGFVGSTAGSAYWTFGGTILALDKETGELSSSVLPDALRCERTRQALEYAYELPWPPTI